MARPHSVRCAYFVEEPITNSFPKPQRSKSQGHNCALNQSANFVVSELQTVGLESCSHKDWLFRVIDDTTVSWRKFYLNKRRYIKLRVCSLHPFYIKTRTIHPICSAFMGLLGGRATQLVSHSQPALSVSGLPLPPNCFRIFPIKPFSINLQ